jgi:uncharacterized membrane protein YccC
MAPPLLVFASMQARPSLAPFAVGEVLGFVNTVGIAPSYQGDFGAFINGAIAQVAGTAVAIIAIDSFNVIGAERAFAKLFRAGFRDIAARAGGTEPNTRRWTSRMMDRIGLIAARAGPSGIHPALPPYDALVGLRIGYLLGELHAFSMCLPDGSVRNAVKEILGALSAHYRSVDVARRAFVGEPVLNALDRALAGFATDPQPERRRRGAILLTGLRRTLFPRAEPFVVVEE